MRTYPTHFPDSRSFTLFLYEIAIRDRESMIDAQTPQNAFAKMDEDRARIIEEAKGEIRAIRARIKRLEHRR